MPVTKSATKKMRVDKRKTVVNVRRKRSLKSVLKKAQETHVAEAVRQAISQIDKAVKNHLLHANKAARMKSALMKEAKAEVKMAAKKSAKKPVKKVTKSTSKKSTAKNKKK